MAREHLIGCILGTAVGDALGLPYEGLSRRRALKLLGSPDRHRLLMGRGMVSDDTELTLMVAQSLIASGGHVGAFRVELARRLRHWLLGLPAGIGLATLTSTVRLWLGWGPECSGVFSAGNGAAVRAAILGASIDDRATLRELVRTSSRITHSDPRAEYGALAVAVAAKLSRLNQVVQPDQYLSTLQLYLAGEGEELIRLVGLATAAVHRGMIATAFADSLGLTRKVSGYVYHTVPVALHAWLSHQHDFRRAVMSVIECGGDTDSTAAIVGGIVGTAVGAAGIPSEWLEGLWEWPRSVAWMRRLAEQLDTCVRSAVTERPRRVLFGTTVPRNIVFLAIALGHGLRRVLPPY